MPKRYVAETEAVYGYSEDYGDQVILKKVIVLKEVPVIPEPINPRDVYTSPIIKGDNND